MYQLALTRQFPTFEVTRVVPTTAVVALHKWLERRLRERFAAECNELNARIELTPDICFAGEYIYNTRRRLGVVYINSGLSFREQREEASRQLADLKVFANDPEAQAHFWEDVATAMVAAGIEPISV